MRSLVFLLSVAGFAAIAVMRVADPLVPVVAAEFHVSIGVAARIISAFSVPYGVCLLAFGPLGDRVGKLRVITATLACASLFIVACGFARSFEALTVLRFLTGISCAAAVPLSLAFIADHVDYTLRQSALARYMSGVILGQIAGAGLGGILIDLVGWRVLFVGYGAATALIAALLWTGTRRLPVPTTPTASLRDAGARYRAMLRDPAAREILLAVFVEGFVLFGSIAFIAALLHRRHELSMTQVGMLLSCLGAGSLLYTMCVRWLMRTLGPRLMVPTGGALIMLAFIALGWAPNALSAGPTLVLLGFALYLMHNTLQTLATELAPAARGTAVALFAFMLFMGQALGVLLLGFAIDRFGYGWTFGATALGVGGLGIRLYHTASLAQRARIGRGG